MISLAPEYCRKCNVLRDGTGYAIGFLFQSASDLTVDGKLNLVAFFDTFIDRVEHLRQFLSHCPVGELKGKWSI